MNLTPLTAGPRWSLPRSAVDLGLWAAAAALAVRIDHPVATALAVLFIGAVPLHDLLVHGHEATHGLAARSRRLNDAFLWAVHALVGMSGTAYRAFHLAHHRHVHGPDDPEVALLSWPGLRPTGWAYLGLPLKAHLFVITWPLRHPGRHASARTVARDLLGAGGLHAVLASVLGVGPWLVFVVLPGLTSLAVVVALRSLTEHHGADPSDRLGRTRSVRTSPLVQWMWSNVNHHREHHLFPTVPWHRLPAVRRQLPGDVPPLDPGYLRTWARLLREPHHWRPR